MAGLRILGACPWWSEAVRVAAWDDADGRVRSVVALLGPELDEAAVSRASERAERWIGLEADGLLPLLGVDVAERRAAWIYPPVEGIALGTFLVDPTQGPVPLRVAAELVGRVAAVFEALGSSAQAHPGPEPDDLLLDPDGTVRVAGFSGPFARSPARREPHGSEDGPALVWRLGVLLAELLTGSPPQPATDPSTHDALVRRLLIRTMARPGPALPERYRDWLVGMLAWDPLARPMLSRIGPGLTEVAATLPGPDLPTWARATVPGLRRRADAGDALRTPEPPLDTGPIDLGSVRSERTEERTIEGWSVEPQTLPEQDDDTAVSEVRRPVRSISLAPEQGAIPVGVGPPPEGLPRPARLPEEIFSHDEELAPRPPAPDPAPGLDPLVRNALAGLTVFLLIAGALLSWYLFA